MSMKHHVSTAGADPAGLGRLSAPTEGNFCLLCWLLFAFYTAFCLPGMIGSVCQNEVP